MATGDDLRRIALSFDGTTEAPHFDRAAFKAVRIYATLAADGTSANLKFTPDEQAFKCMMAPDAFTAIPNGWGRQGWTVARLDRLGLDELKAALGMAYAHGAAKARRKTTRYLSSRPVRRTPSLGRPHDIDRLSAAA